MHWKHGVRLNFAVRSRRLLCAATLALGICAPVWADDPSSAKNESALDTFVQQLSSGAQNVAITASDVVVTAMGMLGVRYKFGGNTPESGLDCSGLVRLAFAQTFGMTLPRSAGEMSRVGDSVSKKELQPGDLVFFNTLRRAFSHVGIYVGDGKFVHAPSSGGEVRVESMNIPYWQNRFNGARRVAPEGEAAVAAVDRAPTTAPRSQRVTDASSPAVNPNDRQAP
jgi:uncharacterized protein YycO